MLERIAAKFTLQIIVVALVVGALIVQTVRIEGFKFWPISIQGYKAENQILKDDRRRYREAQRIAAERNQARVAQIESEQARVTEKVRNDYQNDLARVRAEFERRMRDKANQGSTRRPGLPEVPDPPGGIDGTAQVCVPAEDILYGAETELKLLHLQQWIREQAER